MALFRHGWNVSAPRFREPMPAFLVHVSGQPPLLLDRDHPDRILGRAPGLDPDLGQSSFLGFSAFEAGEFLVLEAVGLGGFKGDFVLDGAGLLRGLNGVELGTEADALFAMLGNFAFQTGAKRFLAA